MNFPKSLIDEIKKNAEAMKAQPAGPRLGAAPATSKANTKKAN